MVQHRIGARLVGFAPAGCEADEVSVILSTSETFRCRIPSIVCPGRKGMCTSFRLLKHPDCSEERDEVFETLVPKQDIVNVSIF